MAQSWQLLLVLVVDYSDVATLRMRKVKVSQVYFATFANNGYEKSAVRLASEANDSNLFDGIYGYTDFPEFILSDERWKQQLKSKKQTGSGFWFWKAPLISNILNQINDGDVLLYADAGCELGNMYQFKKVAEDLCDYDIVGYSLTQMEKDYTKGDVFAEFGVSSNNTIYGESPQILATYISLKNTPQTRKFIQHWESLVANFHLLDDEASIVPNAPTFREPRRDQSLFSMLMKANQPDCKMSNDYCSNHPLVAHKHAKYGVPELRALIREDESYPPQYERALIMSSRNHGGTRLQTSYPQALTVEESLTMKRKVNACREG